MKKFFKVVTVSTMGLLFVLSNDVVAAAARGPSSEETPPSKLAGLLAPAVEAIKNGSLPDALSPKVWEFLGVSDLANLGRVCRDTSAISASKIQTMTVQECMKHPDGDFAETRALRIIGFLEFSRGLEGIFSKIMTMHYLQALSLGHGFSLPATSLSKLTFLEWLELNVSTLSNDRISDIQAMGSRLQFLSLTVKDGALRDLNPLLASLTHVQRLELRGFSISPSSSGEVTEFEMLASMGSHVKALGLKSNDGSLLPNTLLTALTGLDSLDLQNVVVSNESVELFISRRWKHLKVPAKKFLGVNTHLRPLYEHVLALGNQCDLDSRGSAYAGLMELESTEHPDVAKKHADTILELGLPYNDLRVQSTIEFLAHKAAEGLSADDYEWGGYGDGGSHTSAARAYESKRKELFQQYYEKKA